MKLGFLKDGDGDFSSKRLSALVCLLVAIVLALVGLVSGKAGIEYVIAFLTASGGFQGLTLFPTPGSRSSGAEV